ncbi:MAG: hypothetical protein ABI402_15040 [Ferruginibacter sp.]
MNYGITDTTGGRHFPGKQAWTKFILKFGIRMDEVTEKIEEAFVGRNM